MNNETCHELCRNGNESNASYSIKGNENIVQDNAYKTSAETSQNKELLAFIND